jgi:putative ABC transport system permease protein
VTLALLALVLAAPPPGAPDATALLRDADRARGGLESGVSWSLSIESTEDGETTRRSMRVRARSTDALCETLEPPRHKGEVYLFNDRVIWFMKPGLRRPIAISPRQRLQGEASNGDVSATNYVRDYQGTIVGEDAVEGQPTWIVELVAKAADVTYDRIRYWVSKKEHLGVKAEFLTVAGEVFKTAALKYGNRVKLPGGKEIDFISVMTIKDAMGAGGVTVLTYTGPRSDTHAASMFNVNNLVR